jgi:hypothetical protein
MDGEVREQEVKRVTGVDWLDVHDVQGVEGLVKATLINTRPMANETFT